MSRDYQKGDVVYGYAFYHKKWVFCKITNTSLGLVYGPNLEDKEFYAIKTETIVPEELLNSPLWKALE